MESPSPKTYLITGCSSGLGYCLAFAALSTGAKVIATARNVHRSPKIYEDLKSAGATWANLDVESPDFDTQIQNIISSAPNQRIDILINNAGTGGSCRPLEEANLTDARKVFDTNLWGSLRTTQAILPYMRAQTSGCIVNISSASVFDRLPGLGIYAASKAALDTMSASLAAEVAPFGVKVVLVTPSDMRTPFVTQHKVDDILPALGRGYEGGPVAKVQGFLRGMDGKQSIDPVKAAKAIIDAAAAAAEGLMDQNGVQQQTSLIRLPIGISAARSIRAWSEDILKQVERTTDVWSSVEFPDAE